MSLRGADSTSGRALELQNLPSLRNSRRRQSSGSDSGDSIWRRAVESREGRRSSEASTTRNLEPERFASRFRNGYRSRCFSRQRRSTYSRLDEQALLLFQSHLHRYRRARSYRLGFPRSTWNHFECRRGRRRKQHRFDQEYGGQGDHGELLDLVDSVDEG